MTSEKYLIEGEDIVLDNLKTIKSNKDAIITDQDNNKIFLNSFEYHSKDNILNQLVGVKIQDSKKNFMSFQIYIDTKKKFGTDIKAYMNDKNLKINENNKPRIFANTLKIDGNKNLFEKVFLLYVIIEKMINVHQKSELANDAW